MRFSFLQISSPSNLIEPDVISPGESIKLIMALAIVDLPEPDSPTNPNISPFLRENSTLWLATIFSFLHLNFLALN